MSVDLDTRAAEVKATLAAEANGTTAPCPELHRLAELLGLPVLCYDLRFGRVVSATNDRLLHVVPPALMWHSVQSGESQMLASTTGLICLSLPLPTADTGSQAA